MKVQIRTFNNNVYLEIYIYVFSDTRVVSASNKAQRVCKYTGKILNNIREKLERTFCTDQIKIS